MSKELWKGSIDILILSELRREDRYGFAIVQAIKAKSGDAYRMSEGTLYPALKRLESKGFVESYWGEEATAAGRRKYYRITQAGKTRLAEQVKEWNKLNALIQVSTGGV